MYAKQQAMSEVVKALKKAIGKSFTVSNPNDFGVWVGIRSRKVNYDFVVFEHSSESVGLKKGLIRFVSENGIKNRTGFQWTKRVASYTILLGSMTVLLAILLITRTDFNVTIMRQRGSTFRMVNKTEVTNVFEINLSNKTKEKYHVQLELVEDFGSANLVVHDLTLKPEGFIKERFIVKIPLNMIENGKREIHVRVKGNDEIIDEIETKFIGPLL